MYKGNNRGGSMQLTIVLTLILVLFGAYFLQSSTRNRRYIKLLTGH